MTTDSFEPLTIPVPLREDPPGTFRIGRTRVLLELVLQAFKRGASPEAIVRSYRSLALADVYAVISRYLADPEPFERYLEQCEREADTLLRRLENAGTIGGVEKADLLQRARDKGMSP